LDTVEGVLETVEGVLETVQGVLETVQGASNTPSTATFGGFRICRPRTQSNTGKS